MNAMPNMKLVIDSKTMILPLRLNSIFIDFPGYFLRMLLQYNNYHNNNPKKEPQNYTESTHTETKMT